MASEEKVRIEDLLVREGFVTPEQLAAALAHQKATTPYQPLGEICVKNRWISKAQFADLLRRWQGQMRLGELLLNLGLVGPEHIEAALECQRAAPGKRLGQILVEMGAVGERSLLSALSSQLGIPRVAANSKLIDHKLARLASEPFLRTNAVLPAFVQEGVLTLIMADPLDHNTIRDIGRMFRAKVQPAIATRAEIDQAITRCLRDTSTEATIESRDPQKDLVIGQTNVSGDSSDSIVQAVDYLVSRAIEEDASDIHIEPQDRLVRVRYRIDGVLHHVTDLPVTMARSLVSRIKVLCGLDIAERRRHQDGRIEARIKGREVDLRVSTYASVYGESVVIRILHRTTTLVDMDELGFAPANLARLSKVVDLPSGVVLVTGPTGSGKTTTLYAALARLNSADRKIITVEDPVEYTLSGVVQGQLDGRLGMSYSDFLRSMMRQDPDVLMVGEIRDRTAAEAVIQSALTGHKVFSTFHTEDSTGALIRLIDLGIDAFLISSTITAIVAQRLVRRLCRLCRAPTVPDPEIFECFHVQPESARGHSFWTAVGCPECRGTGFSGRTGIHELLVINDAIRDAILARSAISQLRLIARREANLVSMREDGFYKATLGVTTLEEVLRSAFQSESDALAPRRADEVLRLCTGAGAGGEGLGVRAEPAVEGDPAEGPFCGLDEQDVFDRTTLGCAGESSDLERIGDLFVSYRDAAASRGFRVAAERVAEFVDWIEGIRQELAATGVAAVTFSVIASGAQVWIAADQGEGVEALDIPLRLQPQGDGMGSGLATEPVALRLVG